VLRRRLPEPFVFYVDECLGRHVLPEAIERILLEGESIKMLPQGTPDEEWLPLAGERWICLTKDGALRRRPNELAAICRVGAGIVLLGETSGEEQARRVVAAMPLIRRVARSTDLAFIVRLERDVRVTVMYEAGERLVKPRTMRPKPADSRMGPPGEGPGTMKKRRR
jgi:PIN like domain